MARLRFPGVEDRADRAREPIPFPGLRAESPPAREVSSAGPMGFVGPAGSSTPNVLDALDRVSRRMEDLARNLDCLGFFDEGDDGPRAA